MTTTSRDLSPVPDPLLAAPLLPLIAQHATEADRSRSLHSDVVAAYKASDLVRLSASPNLGGLHASLFHTGRELEAVAPACGSTAWTLWNNACVFHLYAAQLGPAHTDLLAGIVAAHETVAFPGGAGSQVRGTPLDADGAIEAGGASDVDGASDRMRLDGPAAFGSGARYGDWVACVVDVTPDTPDAERDLRFTSVRVDDPAVTIDPTWDGAALRASATDDVHFNGAVVPTARCVPWEMRFALRDPERPVIHPPYREDWVGVADIWLGAMATGIVDAALRDAAAGIRHRIATGGRRMADLPVAHANLGHAAGKLQVARAAETDACIAAAVIPGEDDYLRQVSLSSEALNLARTPCASCFACWAATACASRPRLSVACATCRPCPCTSSCTKIAWPSKSGASCSAWPPAV